MAHARSPLITRPHAPLVKRPHAPLIVTAIITSIIIIGAQDPAGLLRNRGAEQTKYFQESELKHGRVAMLASAGFIAAEKFHPLFGGSIDQPSLVAFQATPLQTWWVVVSLAIGVIEVTSGSIGSFKKPADGLFELKDSHAIGDLGFDPLGLMPKEAAEAKLMKTREIMNGRLAMIAIAGMVAQEYYVGGKL
jgi:light-harvesting complex I chlorophyll a/b binding protein 4